MPPSGRWTETNCYVDVWIEVLHALGLDPVAAAAFTLSCDFEGDQWTFFKFPPEDLRTLFGLEVAELNVWRPVVDHVDEQLGLGRLCTVEVDSWFLPDTRGVSYGIDHVKTHHRPDPHRPGRPPPRLLPQRRLLRHSRATTSTGSSASAPTPTRRPCAPYVETVRLDRRATRTTPTWWPRVVDLTREHLARRPAGQPGDPDGRSDRGRPAVAGRAGARDLPSLRVRTVPPVRRQHRAGRHVRRLAERPRPSRHRVRPPPASARWPRGQARSSSPWPGCVRGRTVDLDGVLGAMADRVGQVRWTSLVDRYGD